MIRQREEGDERDKLTLPTEKVIWTINDFVKLHTQKKLIINKEYQRSEVWKQQVGNLRWTTEAEGNAIFDFVHGEFLLPKGTGNGGKRWDELEPPVQWGKFTNRLVYTYTQRKFIVLTMKQLLQFFFGYKKECHLTQRRN